MMVALGGLFTSCIVDDEPDGIKELRYAKAGYIRSLADLSKANEAVVAAEAAYKQAQADHEGQLAALVTAQINLENQKAELQKLENEAQKIANAQAEAMNKLALAKEQAAIDQQKALDAKELEVLVKQLELQAKENELAIAQINDQIKDIENEAKVKAVKSQEKLAQAQADLDETLKGIAAYAMLLTEDEADVVAFAANLYMNALEAYNKAQADYTNAVAETYIKNYDANNLPKGLAKDLEEAKADLAAAQKAKEDFEAVAGDAASWKAEIEKLEADKLAIEKNLTDIASEWAYSQNKYRMCFETFREKIQAMLDEKIAEYSEKIAAVEDKADTTVDLPTNNDYIMSQFLLYIQPYVADGVLALNDDNSQLSVDLFDGDAELAIFTDCLKAGQADVIGLTEIIETFKREKVIVDNEGQAKALADAKKAAEDALAIYNAHKDTLEKGFAAYKPLTDAQKVLADAKAQFTTDSTAWKKAIADSIAAEKAAKTAKTTADKKANDDYDKAVKDAKAKAKQDTADIKAKYALDSAALMKGAEEFAYDINYYYKTIGGAPMDTAKVFAAIKKYAQFLKDNKATHVNVQFFNGTDAEGNDVVVEKFIGDLTLADVVENGNINKKAYDQYVGVGTGASHTSISNAMAYLVDVLTNKYYWSTGTDIDPNTLQINGTLISVLAAEKTDPANPDMDKELTDAHTAMQKTIADAEKAKTDALAANQKAYDDVCKAEHKKVADALTKVNNDNVAVAQAQAKVVDAMKAFAEIYDSFWGFPAGTHAANIVDENTKTFIAAGEDSLAVNYTFNTFEKPSNVVFVNAAFDAILPYNQDLAIILANLANTTSASEIEAIYNDPTIPFVFFNGEYNELADIYFTQAKYDYLSQFEKNSATLEALEKAVNEIVAAYGELNKAMEGVYADVVKDVTKLTGIELTGIDDPNILDAIAIVEAVAHVAGPGYFFDDFTYDFVEDGEYVNLGNGDLLALVKECFNEPTYGDYATKLDYYLNAEHDAQGQINDIDEILFYLNNIYTYALALEEPGSEVSASSSYKEMYDACLRYLDENIEDAEYWLYETQKAYDIMMAGADALTVNKQIAEDWLKYQETKLAEAKKFLDSAKAQYDAVIAKYITK